jgi:hypothetical protein
VLRDDDRSLWTKARDADALQGRAATVYLAEKDGNPKYFKIFEGTVSSRPQWGGGRLKLHLSSGALSKIKVGNLVNEDDFPLAWPAHQGKMLPIVFGKVHKVPSWAVKHGRQGTLREDITSIADLTLTIDGWQDRGGEVITIMIGLERLVGTFDGSVFTATGRGGGNIASGTTRAASTITAANTLLVNNSDLGNVDNAYNGYLLKMSVPQFPSPGQVGYSWLAVMDLYWHHASNPQKQWGPSHRHIYRYDAVNEELFFAPTFTYEDSTAEDQYSGRSVIAPSTVTIAGHTWVPPSGAAYDITTMATLHSKGESVYEIPEGGIIYIVADHPVEEIQGVYSKGKIKKLPVPRTRQSTEYEFGGSFPGIIGAQAPTDQIPIEEDDPPDEFVEINPELYTANLNDTTSFPDFGHAVTTIKFNVPLALQPNFEIDSPDLHCNLKGHNNASFVENPVDVLARITDDYAPDITRDTAAWSSAASSVDWLKCAFALSEKQDFQKLAADIAWQCRCRVFWRDGLLSIKFLRNIKPAAHDTYIDGGYDEGSHKIVWRGINEIITELEYQIRTAGEPTVYLEEDTAAIAAYGRRGVGTKMFWVYEKRSYAQAVARFMLNRMKNEAMMVSLRVPLNQARVELGDWIKLYPGAMFNANQYGEVVELTHSPVNIPDSKGPHIDLGILMPYGWEAPWACPSGDVCYACDVSCDAAADVLSCVVAADIGCDIFDLGGYGFWMQNANDILDEW